MRILLTLLFSVFFLLWPKAEAPAQKKPLLSNYDEVVNRAKIELDSLFQTGAALQVEAAKRGLQGEYVMDITVFDKGKIQSVFMVSSNAVDVSMQNRVKDFIRTIEFGFKVPKSTNFKFRYTFLF
ncbi:MAG: hypothetical protein JNL40_11950 [Cyclobacteriaceae bacterium]|nr:hypothetical protein [Cyclobacteriaceae bacterium]